ncbi:hypothetical protein DID80_04435 [Candidatus Marinamargulisbacteria bacterium SCGC AAA071-K20]|nr:hypothetical protein DID80_04435 [Candidatus Marinamargulisbacteria bacterium SCGC AAA071-K20]
MLPVKMTSQTFVTIQVQPDHKTILNIAVAISKKGLSEGGIPIGENENFKGPEDCLTHVEW